MASDSIDIKCKFFDMRHSNNAARIRLWLRLKGGQSKQEIETVTLTHDDLETDEYLRINPLGKVPALVTEAGLHIFEASVIMQYLEDRFGCGGPPNLVPDGPDNRAIVNLLVRIHDLYIASPNCTQPNFSHTQGCMYLDPRPTAFTPARRTMDIRTRAAKLAEIHKQLTWLEEEARLPYLAGDSLSHADLTWFPTAVFMELLLPWVFNWSAVFQEGVFFSKLTRWFTKCMENECFALTREEIRGTLLDQAERGRFSAVKEEVQRHPEFKWKYI